jgi:hypothetical protein
MGHARQLSLHIYKVWNMSDPAEPARLVLAVSASYAVSQAAPRGAWRHYMAARAV